ncbi:MAG: flagellar protein export ATPase FliI [Syntrophomonadaceae bacterium]|jgi:flagellum-specific ATP synthase
MTSACLDLSSYKNRIKNANLFTCAGKIVRVVGLTMEAKGIKPFIGELCLIEIPGQEKELLAEALGFREGYSILMPLGDPKGIAPGCNVFTTRTTFKIKVGPELLGKVLDSLGEVMNGAPGNCCDQYYPVQNEPVHPLKRRPIRTVLETGIKAIDAFMTCGIGQRMGIFAGSGVGKSTLLGMIARNSSADVNVIALIGERGREVLEFIENDLGKEGLSRSVVVASTSDQPALLRVKGAFVATAIAEYFRDQGYNVLLMMDSVTRYAMAQREIGLAVGEPPTTKGYTPSVFAMLPKLLERAGNFENASITGLYTVLVDGDDMNEPIADAVRGILDGHIILSREIAAQNCFPAIDIMNSISRLMPVLASEEQQALAARARNYLALYHRNQDLINIGAYKKGSNEEIDKAIALYQEIRNFLQQGIHESFDYNAAVSGLYQALGEGESN